MTDILFKWKIMEHVENYYVLLVTTYYRLHFSYGYWCTRLINAIFTGKLMFNVEGYIGNPNF